MQLPAGLGPQAGLLRPPLSPRPPQKAKEGAEGANSNVFSIFEQTQIPKFTEAFAIMDQNRDGFIDKNDLRDTFAALGRVNVKNEEIDEMLKEAAGQINFTVLLTMSGEKLKGADPEEAILNTFKATNIWSISSSENLSACVASISRM
ncbi:Myosin regulatory light chain 2, ventricular/cardiac muscle isoform [Heterocephalus glaber]|uniref:Myosin regulatory light chain 2, ventricular/cardiac muscle isoform n=1 Tax=Heterocephalus glaber TaxID=10181 RepID=G5B4P8_HETGA|nr:Myosin regulatory light chain 2, ventricular/cardiac muscle isoform [Heterocephalus glaber]